jgi:hypothetical protein
VICSHETPIQTICGDIFNHPVCFRLNFHEYKELVQALVNEEIQRIKNIFKLHAKNPLYEYPILKVWTGR